MATWGEYYHSIASTMAIYRETNRRLVELAALRPGMAVVDLGSGSGLTALAALDAVPEGLRLYLVDSSAAMLEAARHHLGDRVAGYILADAQGAPQQLPEQVDRVLCNQAFLSFPNPEEVLLSWRRAVKPLGRLCFNLLGTYFNTGGGVVSPHWALLRLLHQRGEIPRDLPDPERQPNQRSIEATLLTHGFKPFHYEVQEIAAGSDELSNLVRLYPLFAGESRQAAVERSLAAAAELADQIEAMRPQWRAVHFMAQPAISPEDAIMLKFGRQAPKP